MSTSRARRRPRENPGVDESGLEFAVLAETMDKRANRGRGGERRRRLSGKSEGAFRTIGEVAESLDLPPHVLRFWETRFPEIEPVKRAGGRRYYRPRDVELVAAIRHLLYGRGYTIKGVQQLLREQGARAVVESARGERAAPRLAEPAPSLFSEDEAPEQEPPPREAAETAGTPPALREPRTLTLPAVRLAETPIGGGLGQREAQRLRAALADLAECRRLLELTRR